MSFPASPVDPIGDLKLLVDLLGVDVEVLDRRPNGDLRVYAPVHEDVRDGLTRLRAVGLVEWGELHYYTPSRFGGSFPVKTTGPLPILTPAGRRLALAEIG